MDSDKIKNFIKKEWTLIWLVTAIALLAAVISYAAYEESDTTMKRVVAPSAEGGGLFSSNYLENVDTPSSNYTTANFSNSANNVYSYPLTIRNYHQSDPGTVYDGTIQYKLTVKLVHSNGSVYDYSNPADKEVIDNMKPTEESEGQSITVTMGSYTAQFGWEQSGTGEGVTWNRYPVTYTFPADDNYCILTNDPSVKMVADPEELGTDTWNVTYTNIDLGSDLCLQFEANPLVNNPDLYKLQGIIGIASNPDIRITEWSCILNDNIKNGHDADGFDYGDYDAFNYVISGTGNKVLEFSYDPNYVIVNPTCWDFFDEVEWGEGESGWKTITITAKPDAELDSERTASRYDIQIYKNSAANDAVWSAQTLPAIVEDEAGAYVKFKASDIPTS